MCDLKILQVFSFLNYWLYEHPFSENKMDFDKIGLKFNYISEGKIIDNTGDNIGDILKIPKDWLT